MPWNVKINAEQLPIKAHYFFFMAAMGPILPFLPVFGRQLGVPPEVMGSITGTIPLLYLISKPAFGFLADYFYTHRKSIFMGILFTCSLAFILLYFIPMSPRNPMKFGYSPLNLTKSHLCDELKLCQPQDTDIKYNTTYYQPKINCSWSCDKEQKLISTSMTLKIKNDTLIPLCLNSTDFIEDLVAKNTSFCSKKNDSTQCSQLTCQIIVEKKEENNFLYLTAKFWAFVVLLSIGCISFNVSNSISDAICFDVLGEGGSMGYGRQRVWGSIGFGISALLAGYAIDEVSLDDQIKSYTPSFILVIIFTIFDLICCLKLKLPDMDTTQSITKDVIRLLRVKSISIFLVFATIVGIVDSFLIYFFFWYLEDLAEATNYMGQIKLIEGLTVAAETLGGEVIFFSFSGKILKKFGYGYSLTFCFFCYALRLGLISLVPNPWWVVPIEFFMQGPTYALGYTIIVGYASVIAPPGTSATVQGIFAGMDDGLGYTLGSILGGFLYKKIGGAQTFQIFSALAVITGISYFILFIFMLKNEMPKTKTDKNNTIHDVPWKRPDIALQECTSAENAD